jgi:hypothetical protein
MIFVTLFAVCCSICTVLVQRHIRYQRSPTASGGGGGCRLERTEYPWIDTLVIFDHYHDVYYAIVEGAVDFDPNLHPISGSYTLGGDDGGRVKIDGRRIEYSPEKRLLALNPFGEMEEIDLSPAEHDIVRSQNADAIWKVALKRLYRRTGKSEDSVPVGHWTYSDTKGNLAYEGSYKNGRRDGKWTYYYRNGQRRVEINYRQGRIDGDYSYFNTQGALEKTVQWKNDKPIDQTVSEVGLRHSQERTPTSRTGHSW